MTEELNYNDSMLAEEWYSQADDEKHYNKGWEWYLVFCFFYIILEGFFNSDIGRILQAQEYWFTRILPWLALPTDLYFLGIGFIIGLGIIITDSGSGRAPSKGVFGFVLIWILYSLAAAYGGFMHNPAWHQDFRNVILPSIVVPWAVALTHQVRMEVVMSRIIKLSLPFAIANMVRGLLFFAHGGRTAVAELMSSGSWQADFNLLLPYLMAFSQNIVGNKGSKISVAILAIGILAPLHKQTLAIFVFANLFLLFMAIYNGKGNVKLSRTLLTVVLLVIFGAIFAKILLSIGGGAAQDFLNERILKSGRRSELVSGSGRTAIWMDAITRWSRKPVFGEGLGAEYLATSYTKGLWWVPIHNYALQMLLQTGIVGFTIIFIVTFTWIARALRTIKYEPDPDVLWIRFGVNSYILALLATCLFGYYLAARCVTFMFWLLIAMETYYHSRIYQSMNEPYEDHDETT
jgi:O-antigen ligase